MQVCVERMKLGQINGAIAPLRESLANLDAQGDLPGLMGALALTIVVFERGGRDEAAAVTGAIAKNGVFSDYQAFVTTYTGDYLGALEQVRGRLSPEVSTAATARGTAMTYHEAIAYMLAELDAAAADGM